MHDEQQCVDVELAADTDQVCFKLLSQIVGCGLEVAVESVAAEHASVAQETAAQAQK
jgi:hypothetical protein